MSGESLSGGHETTRHADTAKLLIERERDVFSIREEAARNADTQATAITAASLAVAAVAAGGDFLDDARLGWLIPAAALLFFSAVTAGIARVPAMPPPRALLPRDRREILSRYDPRSLPGSPAFGTRRTIRRLGRDLGTAIRASEDDFRKLASDSPLDVVMQQLLHHWRVRNSLARYRMHSKSSWLTGSIISLYLALACATASMVL
jgi:hypothetical protein